MSKAVKSAELLAVEAEHGFVFGAPEGHDNAGGVRSLSVVCTNKDCDRVNRPTDLHDDTVLPVACGGCGQIIHCTHEDTLTSIHHEGDLATPREITLERCVVCQKVTSRKEKTLPPIPIENIPLHLFAGLDLGAAATAASQKSLADAKDAEGMV